MADESISSQLCLFKKPQNYQIQSFEFIYLFFLQKKFNIGLVVLAENINS